jgi:choline dehydrogenase-like flavoprotein
MHLIDINDLESNADITVDACIVGAGAAGITVASELDEASQTVCLIEAGSYAPDEETQSLYDIEVADNPVRQNFMSRVASSLDDRGLSDSTCRALATHPPVNGSCTVKNLHSASRW